MSGFTARMQVRKEITASTALIELTTENGRIQITPSTGTLSLTISAADTASLQFSGIYDLELIGSTSIVERLLQGNFNLDANVTT